MISPPRLPSRILRRVNLHRTTDTCFLSFPKTGNTWLRFLLGRYIQQYCALESQPLFDESDWFGRCRGYCVGPRMHFTHRPLRWDGQGAADLDVGNVIAPFRGKQVILLARHPLDILVSLWMQEKYRVDPPFEGGLDAFIEDGNFGLDKLLRYYRLWLDHRETPRSFMLLRYEDLRRDTASEVRRLLGFIGIPCREDMLEDAIRHASFENMKRLEQSGESVAYQSGGNIFATGDRHNPDAYHVRKGKIQGYREYLDEAHIRRYTERIAADVIELGYQ
jgi:hypothetical protein